MGWEFARRSSGERLECLFPPRAADPGVRAAAALQVPHGKVEPSRDLSPDSFAVGDRDSSQKLAVRAAAAEDGHDRLASSLTGGPGRPTSGPARPRTDWPGACVTSPSDWTARPG